MHRSSETRIPVEADSAADNLCDSLCGDGYRRFVVDRGVDDMGGHRKRRVPERPERHEVDRLQRREIGIDHR